MGRYVDSSLLPGESIVAEGKIHWAVYIAPAVVTLVGVLFLGSTSVVLIAGLVFFALRYLAATSTELALTNKRVIAKFGIIRRESLDVSLSKVEGVNFEQGIVGRMLGYGSIGVRGTGLGQVPVPYIAEPEVFKQQVGRLLHSVA